MRTEGPADAENGEYKAIGPTRSSWRGTDCGLTYFFHEFGGSPRRTAAQESREKGPIKQAQGLSEGGAPERSPLLLPRRTQMAS